MAYQLGGTHCAAALVLLGAIAIAPHPAQADAANNILTVGMGSEPFTLDPATGASGFDYPNLYSLYDRLVHVDPKTNELRPGLATSWRFVGDDKLGLELTIRQGVKFHDGTSLDAEAVKFSLDHFKARKLIADLDVVDSVEVTGPYTVLLKLSQQFSVLPAVLSDRAGMISSPTAIKKFGKDYPRNPVGAGPFKLKQWNSGTSLEMVRFEEYWDKDRIKLAGITYRTILNPTSLVSALISGQIDHAFGVDPKNLPVLKANPRLRVEIQPSTAYYQISLQKAIPPLDNKLVRQALNMSVDRSVLAEAVLGPGNSGGDALMPVPPVNFAYSPELSKTVKYDPVKAKQLLAEAGYPNGITLRHCGTPLVGYGTDIIDIEQEQMKPAGITLDVTIMTGSACLQTFNSSTRYHSVQIAFSGRPDPYLTYQQNFGKNGMYNRGNTDFPGVEELLAKIRESYDPAEQKKYYTELNKLWIENVPIVTLFYRPQFAVYKTDVFGEQPNQQGKPDLTTLYFKK